MTTQFDTISIERLRRRRSEKWRTFSPDVLPAFVAEMDFDLAEPIRSALHEAVDNGDCGYATASELPMLVRDYAARSLGVDLDAQYIFTIPDIMAGVAQALFVGTPPGSAVVINPPVYPPFFEVIRSCGREVMEVPLLQDDAGAWQLDMNGLERAFVAGARGYLLCNPHNPVGRVWNVDELTAIANLARSKSVTLISDEIHAPLTMPGVGFTSLLSSVDRAQRAFALVSASKAWNIPGLKCASMLAGNEPTATVLRKRFSSIRTETIDRVGLLGIVASIAAYREGGLWLEQVRHYLDGNRELLSRLLREMLPDVRWTPPEATYLAWIDCRRLGTSSQLTAQCLKSGKIALSSGDDFGTGGAGYVRLNFGTSKRMLTEIVERVAKSFRR